MTESCKHVVQSPYGIAISGKDDAYFDPCPWCKIETLSSKLTSALDRAEKAERSEAAMLTQVQAVEKERSTLSLRLDDAQARLQKTAEFAGALQERALAAERERDLNALRLDSTQNRLNLAMHMLTELGVDNQYFADKARALIDGFAVEGRQMTCKRCEELERRLESLQVATQNYLDAGPDPSDEIRWALHHALNDPVVERPVPISETDLEGGSVTSAEDVGADRRSGPHSREAPTMLAAQAGTRLLAGRHDLGSDRSEQNRDDAVRAALHTERTDKPEDWRAYDAMRDESE